MRRSLTRKLRQATENDHQWQHRMVFFVRARRCFRGRTSVNVVTSFWRRVYPIKLVLRKSCWDHIVNERRYRQVGVLEWSFVTFISYPPRH